MRILFLSQELGASELALKLQSEGCELKLQILDPAVRSCLDGMIKKTDDWKKELSWVGKDGLIIFDDVGYGAIQDNLRKEGYRVVGGSFGGDQLELDRAYGAQVMHKSGILTLPNRTFNDPEEAIRFLKNDQENRWVIKVNSGHISSLCYVGECYDHSDVIALIKHYAEQGSKRVHLQQRVDGIEIGVGRYFNGRDWVGPIEMNIEHKPLMSGNIGPKSPEMGTVIWYDDTENHHIFQMILARLKEHLKQVDFRGDIDVNCIATETGVWPIEFTARFGNPSTALQIELHDSPWTEFLGAIADQKPYELEYHRGYGVTVTVAVPPYPYCFLGNQIETAQGLPIVLTEKESWEDIVKHYGLEEISASSDGTLHLSGKKGCVAHVCGSGLTLAEAQEKAYSRVKNIVVPKKMYRNDIGQSFINRDQKILKDWGWL